ncbi:hypothetical protein [Tumebacillus flagellatus]|uniref:HEAT repeat domain-containing protein n=1 Tax=Tumebacillus flagellatus TaxID=1157490 RepID=A0A074LQ50_9BACL|nr:hypothetical protein [Tumebacillus flagellatus]KEO81978.1 hypothetical protein EL26_17550 [Tumebacillus flagellatus]
MKILEQLSSQRGDSTEESNRIAAAKCLEDPGLLRFLAEGLQSKDKSLVGDAAEVFTMVAKSHPEHVASYAEALLPLLRHQATRARWEAMHALALTAHLVPDVVERDLLPMLPALLEQEKSTIVRDYGVELLGQYAKTGERAALQAYPLLTQALSTKQKSRALAGLLCVFTQAPSLGADLHTLALAHLEDPKPVVKKAAKALQKATQPN